MDSSQRSDFACRKAREFSEFLKALIEANEYADDLGVSRSEFALGMGEVSQFGLRENDLRWMLKRRWIELPENQE